MATTRWRSLSRCRERGEWRATTQRILSNFNGGPVGWAGHGGDDRRDARDGRDRQSRRRRHARWRQYKYKRRTRRTRLPRHDIRSPRTPPRYPHARKRASVPTRNGTPVIATRHDAVRHAVALASVPLPSQATHTACTPCNQLRSQQANHIVSSLLGTILSATACCWRTPEPD